jgi:orotidine-5'-phosphate decarboxylase
MFVAGATQAAMLKQIRQIVPEHFLLVPGIGAQGGSLQEVCKHAMNKQVGLIINSSRDILYASSGKDFAERAREKAQALQSEMDRLLSQYGF